MSKINILEPRIYNLIAAGEVVERPASVVKELVENSIDAGAKNILVEIKEGGIKFIQVSDDGSGIEEDDIKTAFLPHATSKVKQIDDLNFISTLGFRGEALASIASVSKVTLVSRTEDADIGSSIKVEGGQFGEQTKVSTNKGTTITVEDLFYCVPARAKFLKRYKAEEQEITNIVTRTILAHPEIKFTYIIDGKKNISSIGNTEREALFSVYGKEAVLETIYVHAEKANIKVWGYVGKPTFSKSNRTYQTLIINGRYVVNVAVQTAVSNAYGDFLMKRQYPFFVLYITIPPEEIDVNVHPNKLDIRFLNSQTIYSLVFEAVSRGLNEMDYIKEIDESSISSILHTPKSESAKIDKAGVNLNPFSADFEKLKGDEKEKISDMVLENMIGQTESDSLRDNFGLGSKLLERINKKLQENDKTAYEPENYKINNDENKLDAEDESVGLKEKEPPKAPIYCKNSELINEEFSYYNQNKEKYIETTGVDNSEIIYDNTEDGKILDEEFQTKEHFSQGDFAADDIRLVGKVFNTYLIIEWGDNIYFIDQHAAHERINYEKLKHEYESGNIVVQPMLVPFVLTLNAEDDQILRANFDAIKSVGFEIEEFGDKTYKISTVPAIVSNIDFNKFFSMFLAEKLNKYKVTEAELVKDTLMQMSCKSAVKGGDDLSESEIEKLLSDIGPENYNLFCPHGRPAVVRIKKSEIEKWFKRIV